MGAFLHETMGKDKEIASLKQEFQVNQYKHLYIIKAKPES